jgi:hypothetical protein
MPRFSVKIEGQPLVAAMVALNGAALPTLAVGAHWGSAPPPGWDFDALRAVFDATTAEEARLRVKAALPPDGDYKIGDIKLA